MEQREMKNQIKKFLLSSTVCLIIFALIYAFLVKKYVFKGFSFSYIICLIIIFGALLIFMRFVDKHTKQNKIMLVFKSLILASAT